MPGSSRQDILQLLTRCMGLKEMSIPEIGLMREIIHVWGMEAEKSWGQQNMHRAPEVAALFAKCQRLMLNVSHA